LDYWLDFRLQCSRRQARRNLSQLERRREIVEGLISVIGGGGETLDVVFKTIGGGKGTLSERRGVLREVELPEGNGGGGGSRRGLCWVLGGGGETLDVVIKTIRGSTGTLSETRGMLMEIELPEGNGGRRLTEVQAEVRQTNKQKQKT